MLDYKFSSSGHIVSLTFLLSFQKYIYFLNQLKFLRQMRSSVFCSYLLIIILLMIQSPHILSDHTDDQRLVVHGTGHNNLHIFVRRKGIIPIFIPSTSNRRSPLLRSYSFGTALLSSMLLVFFTV